MSVTNQPATSDSKPVAQQPAPPDLKASKPAAAPVVHQEPQTGGSFTRNLSTGELVKAERAVRQPDQE